MPRVPGSPWATIAEMLRADETALTLDQRLAAAISLADCIACLEAGACSHRDLSGGNGFLHGTRVYIIDWDGLYHAQLPFQPNTTLGTPRHIAPFRGRMRACSG